MDLRNDQSPNTTVESEPTKRAGFIRRHPALVILCLLALVLLVAVGSYVSVLNRRLDDIPRFEADLERSGRPPRVESGMLNVLLVGVDARSSADFREQMQSGDWVPGRFRSDTMMVWHLSEDRDSSQVVSLPRDAWVEIPGHGEGKLNAAFSQGGPELLAHTVEDVTRLYLDHVAVLDFKGFSRIVETLGGVEVLMPDGTVERLDGDTALKYVRTRKSLPNGDFDRIDRQQHLLRAVLEQAVVEGRSNPVTLANLIRDLADLMMIDSGFDNGLLRSLTLTAVRQGAGEFSWATVPHDGTDTIEGQSVVRLDVAATRDLFAAIARDEFRTYRKGHPVDQLPRPDKVN